MTGSRLGHAFALEAVDIGWKIYSRTRFQAGGDPDLPDPIGGTVVETLAYREIDPDTGDISDRTIYRCLDWRRRWQHLDADEIDTRPGLAGLDRNACYAAARWLTTQINTRRRGPLTADESDMLRYAHHLDRAAR